MPPDQNQITFFAKTDARGHEVPFGIKATDRTRHVYVIGKTGMGKSTLLENMAVQDIKNGNGLAFIDPHGQTAETLLNYIPEDRKDDVLYFAPFDAENPVAFNVMEDVGPDRRHLVVSGLMSVFKKIWVDAWSARMEYILQNTLLALLEYPDSTLLGVNRMLSDKEYRKKVIDNISDPSVKSFWVDEFLKYNERYMQEAGDSIKNKIGQFTANPLIRNIIGQPHSSFDIRKMMDEKKIIIMNLSKGLIGESNANLLGSMLTTRIYLAAMSRADLSQEQMKDMPNFYFYVDEFQSFANATFADILSEARKYKLNLTIAHQYIEQMEEEVRNAVFGNVGTIISFRVGPFDAEVLESIFTPKFLAPDIVNLGFAQIYLTLMIDGIGSHPFSATTLPPIEVTGVSCKDMVIANSRKVFAKPRTQVEEAIYAWHETKDPASLKDSGKTEGKPSNSSYKPSGGNENRNGAYNARRPDNSNDRNNNPKPQPRTPHDSSRSSAPQNNENRKPNQNFKGEKKLEDLRSVLKTIAQPSDPQRPEEEKSAPKQEKTEKQEPVQKKELNERRGGQNRDQKKQNGNNRNTEGQKNKFQQNEHKGPSLKDALAQALSEIPKTDNTENKQSTQPVKKETKEQTQTETPSVPKNQNEQKSTQIAAPGNSDTHKNNDALSPKKLERMMRVTTSDKNPFK